MVATIRHMKDTLQDELWNALDAELEKVQQLSLHLQLPTEKSCNSLCPHNA